MPLVGGNELSFFSISFTICFYLVINESSVWWQQAAGCLLAVAQQQPHSLSNLTMFPLHSHADATNHAHPNIGTQPHIHIQKNMFIHTVSCTYFSGCRNLNTGCNTRNQNTPLNTCFFFHIHITRHIMSIILMVLLSPKNIFLIIFNYS